MSKFTDAFVEQYKGTKKIREATPGLKEISEFKADKDKDLKKKIKQMMNN